MFIEDITDVRGEPYPHANCSRESPQVLLHNIPFGKGSPILLFPVDEPFAEGVAEKLYRTQASRSQIMCVANKQWNVMLTLPYPWLVSTFPPTPANFQLVCSYGVVMIRAHWLGTRDGKC
jgi:hypothetical protein